MAASLSIGRIAGIPIRLHTTLLVFLPFWAFSFAPSFAPADLLLGAMGAIGLFASVVLHELAHSLVARAKGAHIIEILLLPIGGLARIQNMSPLPRDEIQIALAGPAASLALGLLGSWGWPFLVPFSPTLAVLTDFLAYTNLMLAFFNLIPSFPMDGGRIFRAWLTPKLGRLTATRFAARVALVIAFGFGIWALLPLFSGQSIRFSLLLIAYFVYQSAAAEARQAEQEAAWARTQTPPSGAPRTLSDDDVTCSPPPYASSTPSPRQPGLFDDLLRKWK